MQILNLTPHTLNIYNDLGTKEIETMAPTGIVPRCSQENVIVANFGGIPIYDIKFGKIEGLPEKKQEVFLVVSRMVVNACPERDDLLSPGPLLRDENGQPKGCIGLSK